MMAMYDFHAAKMAIPTVDPAPVEEERCKRCDGRGNTNRHIPFPDPCPACGGTGKAKGP
jgi:DnaJ-class molecular chaperone